MNRVHFMSTHDNWSTPKDVYRMLEAKQVVCDEAAIDRILYVTPSNDGQLSLF